MMKAHIMTWEHLVRNYPAQWVIVQDLHSTSPPGRP